MSEKMYPIPFASLMNWVVTEYAQSGDIFGVHGFSHLLHNALKRSFLGRSSPLRCQTSD